MPFQFGPYLILGIVLLLLTLSLSKAFHPLVRIIFLWIATWNTHIRLQPKLITPANHAVPNLDYPSRNLWKILGMFCAFGIVYVALMSYAPLLPALEPVSKVIQSAICLLAIAGGAGYVVQFYRI